MEPQKMICRYDRTCIKGDDKYIIVRKIFPANEPSEVSYAIVNNIGISINKYTYYYIVYMPLIGMTQCGFPICNAQSIKIHDIHAIPFIEDVGIMKRHPKFDCSCVSLHTYVIKTDCHKYNILNPNDIELFQKPTKIIFRAISLNCIGTSDRHSVFVDTIIKYRHDFC